MRLAFPAIRRYYTPGELMIINDFCRGELRLYKNVFQSVMKLASKERIGGHIKRKYGVPKTPYQSLMESTQASKEAKQELKGIYLGLNPAELKRGIEAKLDKLFKTYEEKARTRQVDPRRRSIPHTVTFFMIQPKVGLPNQIV